MPLPEFNEFGDLPEGNYAASLAEAIERFGSGTAQRRAVRRAVDGNLPKGF